MRNSAATEGPQKRTRGLQQDFQALARYMKGISHGSITRHRIYSLCVKASAIKCYEFNLQVPHATKRRSAFFTMSALRGICEDLIVLRFLGKIPSKDRSDLLSALSGTELGTRIKQQENFFRSFRPQQPVLRFKNVDSGIVLAEAAALAIWNRHGWPNLKKGSMPNTRQIAEKQGLHQLAVMYDYLYRLTSATVHFSVQSLLRSGWGPSPHDFTFTTKNFHLYFEKYCVLYGAFLFCLYFEFFGSVLRPGAEERAIINEIRRHVIMTYRWPEMVTFEEVNQKAPNEGRMFRMLVSGLQAGSRSNLISKSADYLNKRSSEGRFVREALPMIVAFAKEAAKEQRRSKKSN
jgi:hypothetical protein